MHRILLEQTAAIHRDLDQNLGIVERFSREETKADLIQAYFRFHRSAETMLARHLADIADLNFAARCRASLIAEDLHLLGISPPSDDIPTIDIETRAEALGACYVLEGSTLGGRIITRLVHQDGKLSPGTRFLDPYGSETGAMWRSFLCVLEREAAGDAAFAAKAVSGATKTFALAKTTLSKPTLSKAALSKAKVP